MQCNGDGLETTDERPLKNLRKLSWIFFSSTCFSLGWLKMFTDIWASKEKGNKKTINTHKVLMLRETRGERTPQWNRKEVEKTNRFAVVLHWVPKDTPFLPPLISPFLPPSLIGSFYWLFLALSCIQSFHAQPTLPAWPFCLLSLLPLFLALTLQRVFALTSPFFIFSLSLSHTLSGKVTHSSVCKPCSWRAGAQGKCEWGPTSN